MKKNKGIGVDGKWYFDIKYNVDYGNINEIKYCENFKKLMFNKIYN